MLCHNKIHVFIIVASITSSAYSEIAFEEVTGPSGINHISPSFGISWGDLNGDGWPDVWVGNHYSTPSLYLNNRDGTFTDVIQTVWGLNGIPDDADTHGAAWADFDNDGDQDLIETAGAAGGSGYVSPNHFTHLFVNDGGIFTDKAEQHGIRYNELRGRTPLWVDRNLDGLLDVALTGILRPDGLGRSAFFDQENGVFVDTSITLGFNLDKSSEFGTLSDFNNDGTLDMVFQGNPFPQRVYETTTVPLSDVTASVFSWRAYATDVSISDFNGDLLPDIYMARGSDSSGVSQVSQTQVKTRLKVVNDEKGISFKSTGDINYDLYPPWMQITDVYIGSNGVNPSNFNFTLSKNDSTSHGILPHIEGVDRGVYIGYDPVTDTWKFSISSAAQGIEIADNINAIIQSDSNITNLTAIGFDPLSPPLVDKFWLNTGTQFVERSNVTGLDNALSCNHVVSGDFDNDMDVDIYLVCTDSVSNLPNRLYTNQGDGTFIEVSNAGGAAGTNIGRGENVATADYDQNGFLDLFITNGEGPAPFHNGPHQLFRNIGNSNHWIEIDLEGVASNRDGIGARVFVTAGGITQLREQSGGMHRFSQNHQRLHFGLGSNTQLDSIKVEWPNGQTQKIGKIAVDQIIRIIEQGGEFLPGKPQYQIGTESGLFLWKDSFDSPYHIRMIGSGQLTDFSLKLISTEILSEVIPVKLEQGDTWSTTAYGFSLNARLSAWEDGIDFQLAPKAKALLSVTQDGVPNPRQTHAGINRTHLEPSGWVLTTDSFSERPSFTPATELGLFLGSNSTQGIIEFRMNGDSNNHNYDLNLLSSSDLSAFSTVNINSTDNITNHSNGIEISGHVNHGWDGANISFFEPAEIGFSYRQDSLFSPHMVNKGMLGSPNAYWIPRATPYDTPQFNGLTEAGIFLWKDKDSSQWHLRATAGGGYQRYIGTITSDQPATSVADIGIETNDIVDTTTANQISFDLNMVGGWSDGIDFSFPDGATISFELTTPGVDPESYIKIGGKKWPVTTLPVEIGGW